MVTTLRRTGHSRRPLRAAAALVATLVAAGCAPLTSADPYNASDGVRVDLGGQISAENLLVIAGAEGEPGRLTGALTNDSITATTVTLELASATLSPSEIPLEAGQTVTLGPTGVDVMVDATPAAPGALASLSLASPTTGTVTASVPVLDGTFTPYADMVPTAS